MNAARRCFFAFTVVLCFRGALQAQIGGSHTYEFLNLPFSARTASLGGNLISVKDDDINLTMQNPSLLSPEMNDHLSFSFINYFAGVNYGYAVYSHTWKNIGSFSGGIQYVDYGSFLAADSAANIIGTFGAKEYSVNLGYARQLDSSFSVGATLKTIYSALEIYRSYGNAADLSGTYNNSKHLFTAALVIRNLGMQWKSYTHNVRETLPFEVQLGISKKPKHMPIRFSLIGTHLEKWNLTYEDPNNPTPTVDPLTNEPIKENKLKTFSDKLGRHLIFGAEFIITKNFMFRFGYNYERRKEMKLETAPKTVGFSFGVGIKISKFHLSYGRASYYPQNGANHFTITVNLAEFYKKGYAPVIREQ